MCTHSNPDYEAWAKRFGLSKSKRTSCLCSLLNKSCCQFGWGASGYGTPPNELCRRLCPGGGGMGHEWDHGRLWNSGRRPVVVVSEPYGGAERVRGIAEGFAGRIDSGLVAVILGASDGVHSLWAPGSTTPVLVVNLAHAAGEELSAALLSADDGAVRVFAPEG